MSFLTIITDRRGEPEHQIKRFENEWRTSPTDEVNAKLKDLEAKTEDLKDDRDAKTLANLEACIRARRKEDRTSVRRILSSLARKEDIVLRLAHRAHLALRATQDELVAIWLEEESWDRLEKILIPVVATRRKLLGDKDVDTLWSMSKLADKYLKNKEWDKAEPLLVTILRHEQSDCPWEHMLKLAEAYAGQERWDRAERLLVRVIEGMKKAKGVDRCDILHAMKCLADAYIGQRLWVEAECQLRKVVDGWANVPGKDARMYTSKSALGQVLLNLDKLGEGAEWLLQAAEGRREYLGDGHPDTIASMETVVELYVKHNLKDEAVAWLTLVVEGKKISPSRNVQLGLRTNLEELARLNLDLGNRDVAVKALEELEELLNKLFGSSTKLIQEVWKRFPGLSSKENRKV